MQEGLNYFFRYINNELTEEEKKEEKRLQVERDKKKKSNNPYCAFNGDLEGEEILSIDTH
jgi:hypothetical protein